MTEDILVRYFVHPCNAEDLAEAEKTALIVKLSGFLAEKVNVANKLRCS